MHTPARCARTGRVAMCTTPAPNAPSAQVCREFVTLLFRCYVWVVVPVLVPVCVSVSEYSHTHLVPVRASPVPSVVREESV